MSEFATVLTVNTRGRAFSEVLRSLGQDETRERIAVSDLMAALGDRALGALMLAFALPNVLPVPPGTSAVLGLPLIFLAAQLASGRSPWLPAALTRRSMARADFVSLVRRFGPWVVRAERLLRPRLSGLALPPMEYAIGLVCLMLALVLVLPIPLGNTLPALAISLLALGILERDGVWVIAGLIAAGIALVVVSGVVYALGKALIYVLATVLQ